MIFRRVDSIRNKRPELISDNAASLLFPRLVCQCGLCPGTPTILPIA